MRWKRRLFAAFGLCAALLLTGCQNTMTRIELPSAAEVSWNLFFTTLIHPTGDLEVVAQGDGLNAQVVLDSCDPGTCWYLLGFEIDNTFTSGALVFSDTNDGAFERTIQIARGAGREIFVHYDLAPLPGEDNNVVPITFLGMGPADPRFRSNLAALFNTEPPPGVALCTSTGELIELVGEIGGEIGELPIEIPGVEGDFDLMIFDASSGSGVVSCNGDPPPAAIPTLSQWSLALMAAVLLWMGAALRRRRPV